ncbi:anti-sigma-I factor RsgI family protein [Alkalibacillus almallahensis]|uniref:anti-sigma-I factor RsgI family protein n=1 Tax=Alkalibacillus almallahensis TaxID=1379154 RepID=UPI00141EBA1A|nr:hypothetical protein [Alkalibacillus almallahensis]
MKGIVVERKKRYAIVMTAEGGFYKTKIDSSYTIGEEVQFTPLNEQSGLWSILRSYVSSPQLKAAAAILLCLAIIYPLLSWTNGSSETYAYVNIDINPSFSFEVNDSYQIINAQGLNEDGSELLSEMGDLQGESLQEISTSIVTLSQEKGYLDVDRNILLGVNYASNQSNNNDTYLESLSNDLATEFNQDYDFAWFEVPDEIREQAEQEGTSMNILFASNQLMNQSSNESGQDSDQTESSNNNEESSDENHESDEQTNVNASSSEKQDSNQKQSLNEKFKKFFERMNRDELPPGLRDKFTDTQSEGNEQKDPSKETQNKGSQKSDGHPVFGDDGPPGQSKKEEDSQKNKGKEKSDSHPVFGDDGPPGHNKDENESKNKQNTSDQQDRERDSNDEKSDEERKDQQKDNKSKKSNDHPVFRDDGPPGQNKNKDESEEREQSSEDRDRESDEKESDQEDSEKDGHPVFGG